MKFRKSVSLVLIASQACLGTLVAEAGTTSPTSTTTPEFTLVENVLALQGQDLSSTAVQNQINGLVGTYVATAQTAGSQQRLQQALVQLGVYTQDQAQAFVSQAQSASSSILAAEPTMPNQAQTLVSGEMTQLASLHPNGAEFSGESVGCVGTIAAAAGAVTVITGLILRFDNPSCTTPSWETTTCGPDGCYDSTTYGTTTCTDPGYYPHATAGDDTMIAGGIVLGVGALLMALSGEPGC